MNNDKLYGKLMGVAVGDKFISCEVDSAMNFEKEMIPSSSVTSGKAKEYRPGKQSWTILVNGQLLKRKADADFKTLYNAYLNDEEVTIQFRTRPIVDQYLIFSGKALIQMGNVNAPNTGVSTWSITFLGNSILGMEWEEFWTIINAMPANVNQPNIVDTTHWI